MPRLPLKGLSAGIFVLMLATSAGCSPFDTLMVTVFGRSMRDQPSFDPYENPLMPAQGTVPFAAGNYAAAPGEWNLGQPQGTAVPAPFNQLALVQSDPAVVDLVNPVEPTAESLARGEELYLRTCAVCHGEQGFGNGTVTQAGMVAFPLISPQAVAYTDGYLYGMIRVGRGLMPPYGHQVGHFDRWNIVNYVRSLQGVLPEAPATPPEGAAEPASPGN